MVVDRRLEDSVAFFYWSLAIVEYFSPSGKFKWNPSDGKFGLRLFYKDSKMKRTEIDLRIVFSFY